MRVHVLYVSLHALQPFTLTLHLSFQLFNCYLERIAVLINFRINKHLSKLNIVVRLIRLLLAIIIIINVFLTTLRTLMALVLSTIVVSVIISLHRRQLYLCYSLVILLLRDLHIFTSLCLIRLYSFLIRYYNLERRFGDIVLFDRDFCEDLLTSLRANTLNYFLCRFNKLVFRRTDNDL